jgi:hypothetical protein
MPIRLVGYRCSFSADHLFGTVVVVADCQAERPLIQAGILSRGGVGRSLLLSDVERGQIRTQRSSGWPQVGMALAAGEPRAAANIAASIRASPLTGTRRAACCHILTRRASPWLTQLPCRSSCQSAGTPRPSRSASIPPRPAAQPSRRRPCRVSQSARLTTASARSRRNSTGLPSASSR